MAFAIEVEALQLQPLGKARQRPVGLGELGVGDLPLAKVLEGLVEGARAVQARQNQPLLPVGIAIGYDGRSYNFV